VLPDSLPGVSVDPASIIEVVYMLLDNASKYSPPGTTIRVTAGPADERYVNLAVIDQGPGVPHELRERVFENFYRVPAREPRDPRRVGIGLGLPIARRLVEAQGGRIWIETPASGSGTAAVLMLPAAPVEAAARSEGIEAPAAVAR
jgi:two-component system sensor histidine kinase KdpD